MSIDYTNYCNPRTQNAIRENKLTDEQVLTMPMAQLKALPLMGYATVQEIMKYRDWRAKQPVTVQAPLVCEQHICSLCNNAYWKPVGLSKDWRHCPVCGGY